MTDCPTNEMALQGVPGLTRQPFTVILIITDDMRSDEACAADWLRRAWVYGNGSDQDGISEMIERARDDLSDLFGWTDQEIGLSVDEIEERKAALEPVAIYPGHLFDIYRP